MKILVVEDEKTLAEVLKDSLEKEKYKVDVSYDGEEGEYNALTGVYDLILLDVMLPYKNGFDILKSIRDENIESKVIMLTAKAELEDKLNGLQQGADDYITKPFHIEEVIARVNIQLKKNSTGKIKDYVEFSDIKLDLKKMHKRNNTIICNTDCILGVLIKKDYISCLKITQTKFHKNDINFLISNELFSMMNFREFDNNYYHLFEYKKLHEKQILFEQGELSNKIFFLKKGEVSITFEGSFNDIYRIISLKGGQKNRKESDINYIKRFHSINLDENIFKQKQKFTLFKIKENFPIGLDDFLDEENDNKILFNAYCLMNSEVFIITRENFDEILYRENEVRKIEKNYVIKRKKILIDELNIFKNGLIQNYISEKFNVKIELPYLLDDSTLLLKSKSMKKNYLTKPKKIKYNQLKLDTKLNDKLFNEMQKAIKSKIDKENSEIQKYKYLNSENNKTFRNNNDNNNLIISISSSAYRENINNNRIKNIKESSSLKNKFNKDILDLIKSQNIQDIINSRKKNDQLMLDPYEKIYNTLKNDEKNKITDFSYLNFLYPPHPNKQISKSKKNIFNRKLLNLNLIDKSMPKLSSELFRNKNTECHKNIISSMNILNKNKENNKKQKLAKDEFQLNKFIKDNDKLNQIFERVNTEKNISNLNRKDKIVGTPIIFPKINK